MHFTGLLYLKVTLLQKHWLLLEYMEVVVSHLWEELVLLMKNGEKKLRVL